MAYKNKADATAYARRWYQKNKHNKLYIGNLWRKRNPERMREIRWRKTHGLTVRQYDSMLEAQKECCAICRRHAKVCNTRYGRLYVDHDHKTGHVRGLLCTTCNRVLGLAKDSIEILRAAEAYLSRKEVPGLTARQT